MDHTAYITALNRLLANHFSLYVKTLNYHWHMKGPQFFGAHEALSTQYKDIQEAIDGLAERIVQLGGRALATLAELKSTASLPEGRYGIAIDAMLADLADSHETLIHALNEVADMATEHKDNATLNFIGGRCEAHATYVWMLRSVVTA